jgi:hypothetical protein
MPKNWRFRLAGLAAAIALVAAGPAYLVASQTAASAAVAGHTCPGGTHWDNATNSCVS